MKEHTIPARPYSPRKVSWYKDMPAFLVLCMLSPMSENAAKLPVPLAASLTKTL